MDSKAKVVKLQSGKHRNPAITVEAEVIDGCSSEGKERVKVTDEAPTAQSGRHTDRPSALPSIFSPRALQRLMGPNRHPHFYV